jgi:FK506-binding nuclear protein
MKKKKAHEPTTVSVLKKESNETIEKPLKQRTLPGGITYSILSIGEGKIATVGKHVRVKYEGRLASTGKKFDHGTLDFTIGAGEMIKGFDIGIRGTLWNISYSK